MNAGSKTTQQPTTPQYPNTPVQPTRDPVQLPPRGPRYTARIPVQRQSGETVEMPTLILPASVQTSLAQPKIDDRRNVGTVYGTPAGQNINPGLAELHAHAAEVIEKTSGELVDTLTVSYTAGLIDGLKQQKPQADSDLAAAILDVLDSRDLSKAARLNEIRALVAAVLPLPACPDWCVACDSPDPGVVDHYSQEWSGVDGLDGASWRIVVTQRYEIDRIGPATLHVNEGEGAFGSVVQFARDLLAAQELADRINSGGAR